MFREADKNGDGTVSWVEFLDMTKKRMKGVASKPSIAGSLGGNLSNDRRTEIMKMFNRMDPNGNGFVDRKEFEEYMINNDVALGVDRVSQLFETIKNTTQLNSESENMGITIQDLVAYFEQEQEREEKEVAPMPQININSIKVNILYSSCFRVIINIQDMDQYFAAAALAGANLSQDSLNVIGQGLFYQTLTWSKIVFTGLQDPEKMKDSMEVLLSKESALGQSLGDQEKKRWKPFSSFKRRIDRKTVMSSPSGIFKDILPGTYDASNIVDYTDLPPIEPQKTIVKGVQWIEGKMF